MMMKVQILYRNYLQKRNVHFIDIGLEQAVHEKVGFAFLIFKMAIEIPPFNDIIMWFSVIWEGNLFILHPGGRIRYIIDTYGGIRLWQS